MKINIAELIKNDSKHIVFDEQCEGFASECDYSIRTPIAVTGELWYENNILKFFMHVSYIADTVCARCLEPCVTEVCLDLEDDVLHEDVLEAYGADFDIKELMRDQIILNMPLRVLCSEECKGLCSICGCNLNNQTCDCMSEQYSNSQFAALQDWQSKSGKE